MILQMRKYALVQETPDAGKRTLASGTLQECLNEVKRRYGNKSMLALQDLGLRIQRADALS